AAPVCGIDEVRCGNGSPRAVAEPAGQLDEAVQVLRIQCHGEIDIGGEAVDPMEHDRETAAQDVRDTGSVEFPEERCLVWFHVGSSVCKAVRPEYHVHFL